MRAWAAALCAVSLGCTAVQMLVGDKGAGRIVRIILACWFLCAVAAPLPGWLSQQWCFGEVSDEGWLQQGDRYTLAVLEGTVLREANKYLERYGYRAEKSQVITDISQDGSISIDYIVLYVDAESYKQSAAIRQLMGKHLGCETVVRLYEG